MGQGHRVRERDDSGLDSPVQCRRPGCGPLSPQWWPPPLFAQEAKTEIVTVAKTSTPREQALPGPGWTLKKLQRWVADRLGRQVSRNTLRTILRAAGLRWKQCKKLLANGDPVKRTTFVEQFQALYERMCRGEVVVVY